MKRINMGDLVRDQISGVQGIVIGYHYWLFGCERVTVQPRESKDGKPADNFGADAAQCEVVTAACIKGYAPDTTVVDSRDVRTRPAGPRPDAARPSDPTR